MCAIIGISLPPDVFTAIPLAYDSLRNLQSRGQSATGVCALYDRNYEIERRLGLVTDVYQPEFLRKPATAAIGHNRYATQGENSVANIQPHLAWCRDGYIAVASNGDIPRYAEYRRQLEAEQITFKSTNDGELLALWLARAYDRTGSMPEAITMLQTEVEGAYSTVCLLGPRLFAFRDIRGFRPMMLSALPGGGVGVASEGIAFDIHKADPMKYQTVQAGAILEMFNGRLIIHQSGHPDTASCIFELIYFSHPNGVVFDWPVEVFRRRCAWLLARRLGQFDLTNAVVSAVPDSANELALGVAEYLRVPHVNTFLRSHFTGRSFISPAQGRDERPRLKFNPSDFAVRDRHIILTDDSIVRGETMHSLVSMLRRHGAASITLLIASPPVKHPCFMGIATPTYQELIANQKSVAEIAEYLQVDQLHYLSLAEMKSAAGPLTAWERKRFGSYFGPRLHNLDRQLRARKNSSFCHACFSGKYAITVPSPQ